MVPVGPGGQHRISSGSDSRTFGLDALWYVTPCSDERVTGDLHDSLLRSTPGTQGKVT